MTPPTEPELRVYAWMALDAYDSRSRTNAPLSEVFADPDVETAFPDWERQPTSRPSLARNADAAYRSGLEANVYVNDSADHVVIAFRGTEFNRFVEALLDFDLGLIRGAHLDNDVLTLAGYYQDDGRTLEDFVSEGGGLAAYLEDLEILDEDQVADLDDLLGTLDVLGLGSGIAAIARAGEQDLRNQVQSALVTVIEVAAANPGAEITLTGHSLGGALAAALGGALGIPAVLFDPAPYAAEGLLAFARAEAIELTQGLDIDAFGWDLATPPETLLADITATERLEGSFVEGAYLTASPLDLPEGASTDRVTDLGAFRADPFFLHSPELLTLAIDSEARESEDRPSLETLSRALPGLVRRLDSEDLIAPLDTASIDFVRALLVFDPLYGLFADLMERILKDLDRFAPEGAEGVPENARARLEVELIDIALDALGDRFAAGDAEEPGSVSDAFGSPAGGDGDDVIVGVFDVAEVFAPGLGTDFIAFGAGADDTLTGGLAELDGDRLFDLSEGDVIVVEGASFGAEAVTIAAGRRALSVDQDGDGTPEATITLGESVDPASLTVSVVPGGTEIRLAPAEDGLGLDEVQTVALLYEAGLGRPADDTGLNFWIDRREDGLTETALSAQFLGAPEFADQIGDLDEMDDLAFVGALYENVLDRPGDADGLEFWTGQLALPEIDRDDMLLAFVDSLENVIETEGIDRLAEVDDGEWSFL